MEQIIQTNFSLESPNCKAASETTINDLTFPLAMTHKIVDVLGFCFDKYGNCWRVETPRYIPIYQINFSDLNADLEQQK